MNRHQMSRAPHTLKVLHVISSLSLGGAETMLYKLLSRLDQSRFPSAVVSLTPTGGVGARIAGLGIAVESLRMKRGLPSPVALGRLGNVLRRMRPDIVQGWMYHGNVAAWLGRATHAGATPLICSIRHSLADLGGEKRTTRWMIRLGARVSRSSTAVIYNSDAAARQHEALGYMKDRTVVIPNGFDVETFRPDAGARASLRKELGLGPDTVLIGLIGRYHPVKNHADFIRGGDFLKNTQVHFVMAGSGVDPRNEELTRQIRVTDLQDRVHLLGERDDMPRVHAALDIATSASTTEAFPNVIGEAMACAVPCVVTDVGDSAGVVGDTGVVVPPKDPERLAGGWDRLLSVSRAERTQLGQRARRRIEEHYSLTNVVRQYERLYETTLEARAEL